MRLLPRTIRLDDSDRSVFDHAAEPGEWAVTGSFAFLDEPPEAIIGKRRQAFAHGFMGTSSFGWSTFVMVAHADDDTVAAATEALARHFVERHGAPSIDAARPVAAREIAFTASLCQHPVGTLLTVSRRHGPDGVIESFATVSPDAEPGQGFDLIALA
ncbi:MAG TPA: DUF6505 family protein, partial [Acetobacteraceae bacterium]|nr:DUF6505 family protein [Acetobacteraceae bacterium]